MATSNVYQRQTAAGLVPNALGVLPDPVTPAEIDGRVRILYASIDFEDADAVGVAPEVAILPKGARLLSAQFNVINGLNAGTASLGIAGDVAKYIAATAVTSAGFQGSIVASEVGVKLTEDTTLLMTTATGDPVAADQIDVMVEWVLD